MTIDFNHLNLSNQPINLRINELIEQTEPKGERRQYLGASSIGDECMRKTQYTWQVDPTFSSIKKDIFGRGDDAETRARNHLIAIGFKFVRADSERLKFQALDGIFCGHADGLIEVGPEIPELTYPCIWENKCLKADGFRKVQKYGLVDLNKKYAAQVALYQHFLNVTNPALFTVENADDCTRLYFTVPFDAQLAQEMIDRAITIINATRAGELLPRAYKDSDNFHCAKICSFKTRCWGLPS